MFTISPAKSLADTLADQLEKESQTEFVHPKTFTFYWENDSSLHSLLATPSDRHYTNGIKITVSHQSNWATELAQSLQTTLPLNSRETPLKAAFGYQLAQKMFTPSDLSNPNLQPNDHPYAGILYIGAYLQRATNTPNTPLQAFDHFEINIGVIGDVSLAGETQRFIHRTFNATKPAGWVHQLKDEIGLNATYRRKWRIDLLNGDRTFQTQIIPSAGITLGTLNRELEAGATWRAGWHLPNDFGPGRLDDTTAETGHFTSNWSFYTFVRTGARLVEHDTLLEGNNFRDSHGVKANPFVGELQIGFATVLFRHLQIGWGQTFQTKTFNGQEKPHRFGTWTLAYQYYF